MKISQAEEKMVRDLKKMDEKMKYLKKQVTQVRAKYEYQRKDASPANATAASSSTKAANPNLVLNFKDILSEEWD